MRLAIDPCVWPCVWFRAIAGIIALTLTPTARAAFVQRPTTLPGLTNSAVAWGDYDRDGDLDLALAGALTGGAPWITAVYRNDGGDPPVFIDIGAGLPPTLGGAVAWGDFDNDGDLDLVLTGKALLPGNKTTKVYRNTGGSPPFVELPLNLTGFAYSDAAWGDYDNDGDLDIVIYGAIGYGWNNDTPSAAVFINHGDATFSDAGASLVGTMDSAVRWVDFDRDGDLDLMATGTNQQVYPYTHFLTYSNPGASNPGLELVADGGGVYRGSVDYADCNGDGRLDLLLAGYAGGGPMTAVYSSSGDFTQPNTIDNPWFRLQASLLGTYSGSAGWGDFDNDGRSDLVAIGISSGSTATATIHRNNGGPSPNFSDLGAGLEGLQVGGSCWGDYDSDGDLDLLITGRSETVDGVTTLYRNDTSVANQSPAAPADLASQVLADPLRAKLQWQQATDSETPGPSLTYNLRIGTTPGGSDICSPMALPSGQRLLPASGNTETTRERVVRFPHAGRYYWSVQSVDAGFAGSAFAPEQFVDVGTATDTPLQIATQASALDLRIRTTASRRLAVEFSLPEGGRATVEAFAVNGRRIGELLERDLDAGTYVQTWDTSRLARGVYLLRLSAPRGQVTRRAVLR